MKNEIKKTVVPQFVAEWFEENKWDLEYEIYNVITEIFSKDSSEYSKIEQWFDSNFWNGKNNYPIETVVRMQDGYTIEKEPLYSAKVKGTDDLPTGFDKYFGIIDRQVVSPSWYPKPMTYTMSEWNEVGINKTNADFDEVED